MIPKRDSAAANSPMQQGDPYAEANPPGYTSARDPGPSTSSAIVVASQSGYMHPTVAPQSGLPVNGVDVSTIIEPIRGL